MGKGNIFLKKNDNLVLGLTDRWHYQQAILKILFIPFKYGNNLCRIRKQDDQSAFRVKYIYLYKTFINWQISRNSFTGKWNNRVIHFSLRRAKQDEGADGGQEDTGAAERSFQNQSLDFVAFAEDLGAVLTGAPLSSGLSVAIQRSVSRLLQEVSGSEPVVNNSIMPSSTFSLFISGFVDIIRIIPNWIGQ